MKIVGRGQSRVYCPRTTYIALRTGRGNIRHIFRSMLIHSDISSVNLLLDRIPQLPTAFAVCLNDRNDEYLLAWGVKTTQVM